VTNDRNVAAKKTASCRVFASHTDWCGWLSLTFRQLETFWWTMTRHDYEWSWRHFGEKNAFLWLGAFADQNFQELSSGGRGKEDICVITTLSVTASELCIVPLIIHWSGNPRSLELWLLLEVKKVSVEIFFAISQT